MRLPNVRGHDLAQHGPGRCAARTSGPAQTRARLAGNVYPISGPRSGVQHAGAPPVQTAMTKAAAQISGEVRKLPWPKLIVMVLISDEQFFRPIRRNKREPEGASEQLRPGVASARPQRGPGMHADVSPPICMGDAGLCPGRFEEFRQMISVADMLGRQISGCRGIRNRPRSGGPFGVDQSCRGFSNPSSSPARRQSFKGRAKLVNALSPRGFKNSGLSGLIAGQ